MKWLFKLFFRKQKGAHTAASGMLKHWCVHLYKLLKNKHWFVHLYKLLKNEQDTSNSFFVSNDAVEVYHVVFSNDVTALKPSIQFDKDRNVNVELENHDTTLE